MSATPAAPPLPPGAPAIAPAIACRAPARRAPLSPERRGVACRCDGGNVEVVKILLANQADVNQPDMFNKVRGHPCPACDRRLRARLSPGPRVFGPGCRRGRPGSVGRG